MKTRKTHTTTTTTQPKPAALLAALAALTLTGATTAEARTQRVDRGPSPVTTVSQEQIERTGVTDVGELLNRTPGVRFDRRDGDRYAGTNVNLRGLGDGRTLSLINGRRYAPNQDIYGSTGTFIPPNIEQIEVLRGPQGTLYGRNADGGAIHVVTRGGHQSDGIRYNNPGIKDHAYNWNTGRINTQLNNRYETQWNPDLTTAGAGLNTTLNTPTTETTNHPANNPTHTPETETTHNPTETPTANSHQPNTPAQTETTRPANTHRGGIARETGDSTGIFNQPATVNDHAYGSPCPKVRINWDAVADGLRQDSANRAVGLLHHSQERPFFDYNAFNYNTTADELANRDALGQQLAQGMTVTHDYVGGPEAPKTYYRVGGGMFEPIEVSDDSAATTTKTEQPAEEPLPTYKPVVRPINAGEMTDRQLELEIKYGPSITNGYAREATGLRDDAKRYRKWAKERREQAARARSDAEDARKKAKSAKTKDSREFWQNQAKAYDAHADILEDSAKNLDRAAQDNDNAATTYEQDAAQSAANVGQAAAEQANRIGQRAAAAARAEAERQAAAQRAEAERQRKLDELIRQSQQNTQSDSGDQPNKSAGNRPKRPYRPDGRVPRPGKESRNETLRKLLD